MPFGAIDIAGGGQRPSLWGPPAPTGVSHLNHRGVFTHVVIADIDPDGILHDAVNDRVSMDPGAEPLMPVFFRTGATDRLRGNYRPALTVRQTSAPAVDLRPTTTPLFGFYPGTGCLRGSKPSGLIAGSRRTRPRLGQWRPIILKEAGNSTSFNKNAASLLVQLASAG